MSCSPFHCASAPDFLVSKITSDGNPGRQPWCFPVQISVFARHARDEILLLASDGLWDVLSNQEATELALRSIKRARVRPAAYLRDQTNCWMINLLEVVQLL